MRIILRWLKGTFWFLVVMLAGILYFQFVSLEGLARWLGLIVLAAVLWPVVSKLRERLHF